MECKNRCVIADNKIEIDGEVIFSASNDLPAADFLTAAYRALKMDYPKFFKMDYLSKSAWLGMEVLMRKISDHIDKEQIPVILYNSSSSIEVDTSFQQSMESIPSPSLFVYTLPNVMIGEICIRHKLYGENYLFITEKQDENQILRNTEIVLQNQPATECITGYVEYAGGKMQVWLGYGIKNEE